jgi:hypothetical protein
MVQTNMAFDPDKYLAEEETPQVSSFDPDAYLAEDKPTQAAQPTQPVIGPGGAAFGIMPRVSSRKPAPSLEATEPAPVVATGRDFTALNEELKTAVIDTRPNLLPEDSRKTRQMGVPKLATPDFTRPFTPKKAAELPNVVQFATDYFKSSRPNKPIPKDPVKLMEEFQSSFNKDTLDEVRDLTRLLNASPKQREMELKAREIAGKMSGNELAVVGTIVTDPFTYVGAGAGFMYKQAALRGTQSLARTQLKTAGVTAATEGAVAAGTNIVQQKQDVELAVRDEVDYVETAVVAGLSIAVEGAIAAKTVASGGKRVQERIQDLRATAKPAEIDKATEDFKAKFAEKEKQVLAPLFESAAARQETREATLDAVSPPTDAMESVLKKPIVDDIFKVAKQLFTDNPDLRPNLAEVRTVQGIVDALNIADEDVIQQAALRAGVKPADFLEMFKVQASEAGAFLQQAKSTADMLRKMTKGDPALEDAFTRMMNAGSGTEYWSGDIMGGIKATTGASVAASTAGLSTAVMNAIGLTGTLGIQVAGDVMEATIKSTGRMVNDLRGGAVPVNATRVKEEIGTIFADGGFVLSKLMDAGYTKELADMALKNNPRLNNLITNVGAQVEIEGGGGVNDVLRTINIFNRAVDGVVRGPIFIQSVKNRMKDVGLDFDDFMANDKPVPTSLLKAAAEDTMKMTFSYGFKKTGEKSIEGISEDLAFGALNLINSNASLGIIKDFVSPFIRFQLNAVRYTYRMTPMSGVGGYQELMQAAKLRDQGKIVEAAGMSYEGKRKVLDSAVGTAAIVAGMAFREDNADVQFYQYKDKDGNVKDGSMLFPYVNIMALAEVSMLMKDVGSELWYTVTMTPEERAAEAVKIKEQSDALEDNDSRKQKLVNQYESLGLGRVRNFDGRKFTEIMTGMGRSAGTQKTVFDTLAEAVEDGISSSAERKAGQAIGDFVSRFDNVLNPVYDAVNFLRDDMRIVDAKASTALAGQVSPGVESAIATVVSPIPVARDILQSRPSLFQDPEQQTPTVARQVTGTRPTPPTTAIEKELVRLNIQPYTVVKTTGNRDLDNLRIELAAPEFRAVVSELIDSPDYKAKSMNEQQAAIKSAMNEVLGEYKEDARELFLEKFGQSAIDTLYSRAPNRAAQEDAFVRLFNRKPTTNADKFAIIEGEFKDVGAVGKAKGGLASRR